MKGKKGLGRGGGRAWGPCAPPGPPERSRRPMGTLAIQPRLRQAVCWGVREPPLLWRCLPATLPLLSHSDPPRGRSLLSPAPAGHKPDCRPRAVLKRSDHTVSRTKPSSSLYTPSFPSRLLLAPSSLEPNAAPQPRPLAPSPVELLMWAPPFPPAVPPSVWHPLPRPSPPGDLAPSQSIPSGRRPVSPSSPPPPPCPS